MDPIHLKTNQSNSRLTNARNSISFDGRNSSKITSFRKMGGQASSSVALSDEQLVSRFRETTDTRSLQVLLDRYDRYIAAIALPFLKNDREEIRDLKQDLFIKLYEKLQDHEPETFKSWLGRLVRNHVYDKYLRKKRPDILEELPEQVEHVIHELDLQLDVQQVMDSLETLRPDQRLYVEMAFFGGMKNAEIAEQMGWSPNKTRGLYDRALASLKKSLGDASDEFSSYFQDL